MSNKRKQQFLWLAVLATFIWSLMMTWEIHGYHQESCASLPVAHGASSPYASPIAALSLTRSATDFELLVDQCHQEDNRLWNIHVAQANTCMDFLLIALYLSVFVLFTEVLKGGKLTTAIRVAILIAALMDVAENVCLLRSLHVLQFPPGEIYPPGTFSLLKWLFFALALLLLTRLIAAASSISRIRKTVMVTPLVLSALALVGGVFYLPLLTLAVILFGVTLLAAGVLFFPIQPYSVKQLLLWLPVIYLLRFQIMGAMLVAVILPVLYFAAPSIFIGIFDTLGFKSFVCVVWVALQLTWTVMITSRMIFVYGADRYEAIEALDNSRTQLAVASGVPGDDRLSWPAMICFGALALPTIVMAIADTSNVHWWEKILGSFLGAGLSLLVLWLTANIHAWIEGAPGRTVAQVYPHFGVLEPAPDPRSRFGRFLDSVADRVLPDSMIAGILDSNGRLRSGHQLALTLVLVLIVMYAAFGVLFSPSSSISSPAAIFFLLFLFTLLTWIFSGLAFFLDVLRLPVLTCCLLVSLALGSIGTDHIITGENSGEIPPAASEVVKAWQSNRRKADDAPIIVVATAGGGIRASAWTAEVLTRLALDCQHTDRGDSFASSLLLVSSVSGGSEGAMYVLGSYDDSGNLPIPENIPDDQKLKDVRDDSSETALSAIGWGVLYPDLLRTVPVIGWISGALSNRTLDRGWALQNQWIKTWKNHPWSTEPLMSKWIEDTRQGRRPAVLFNITAAETGQRVVVGSTGLLRDGEFASTAVQFAHKYPRLDIPVATAARLSASFSWVSPMPSTQTDHLHFADGGYFDNSGLLSVGDWLLAARNEIYGHPVYLIVIDANDTEPSAPGVWSWQRQLIGPITTLNSVRSNSQQSRSQFELPLLINYLDQRGIRLSPYRFFYPKDRLAPLSWHLTPVQQHSIGQAWSNAGTDLSTNRDNFYRALGCKVREK